ncbi:MAG: SufE family protein [Chlamydiales bacterium]|nr:SufE family protein [Chlamydiales bacterium]
MHETCLSKQAQITDIFKHLLDAEAKYLAIIDFGKKLPPFPENEKVEKNLVKGCQSIMYLTSYIENNKIYFLADSEALISRGIAALLTYVYSGEALETIFQCPPHFLKEIDIFSSLSMNRSNGLKSLFTQMQKETVLHLSKK